MSSIGPNRKLCRLILTGSHFRVPLPVNDVLGNRAWRNFGTTGVQRYVWDEVNRLKSVCGTEEGARYEYRADGMRMQKVADLTIEWNPNDNENEGSGFYDESLSVNKPTTLYFYYGQMPMEEDHKVLGGFGTPTVTVTQYGLGARGIDWIRDKVGNNPEAIVFPIYDGHGNMVYTLKRDGTHGYLLGNKRIYGAWGDLRHDGNPGDGPNTQYCANLGHKKDNESGLTYMRARYYEPWTGRFVNEDPARDGWNWLVYCGNDPVQRVDPDGEAWWRSSSWQGAAGAIGWFLFWLIGYAGEDNYTFVKGLKWLGVSVLGAWWNYNAFNPGSGVRRTVRQIDKLLQRIGLPANSVQIAIWAGYALILLLVMDDLEEWVYGS